MDVLKEVSEKIKQGKMVFKAEDITVLNNIYNNSIKLVLLFNEGQYKNKPIVYFIGEDRFSDKIEDYTEATNVYYVDGDYAGNGLLGDALLLAKQNAQNKKEKNNENKLMIDYLSELPILPSIADKDKFTRSELLSTERHYNAFVKDLQKKEAFQHTRWFLKLNESIIIEFFYAGSCGICLSKK